MTSPTPDSATRILDAAADLFAARGFAGTTTRALAEGAGVNEVTVFRRFGSKQGVLRGLAARIAAQTAGAGVPSLDDTADLRDTLVALAETEVRSALGNGGLALRLAFDARSEPAVAEVLGPGTAGNQVLLASYLAARQRAGELRADAAPALLAETFFAMTSSLVLGRMLTGSAPLPTEQDVTALAAQLVDLYLGGAAAAPSAPPPTTTSRTTTRSTR